MTVVTVCEEQNGSAFSQEGRPNVLIVGYFMHSSIIQVATHASFRAGTCIAISSVTGHNWQFMLPGKFP